MAADTFKTARPPALNHSTRSGCRPVNLGERILRVETAVAALVGRIF